MDNGDMNMDGKVISLTELNEFANMSVSDFVHQKYGDGWTLESDFSILKGAVRIFKDKNDVKYTIEYIKNENGVLVPNKILRICGVIVDIK
jgi:hypothetical protein